MNTTAVVIVAICAWALVSIVTAAKDKSKSKKDIRSDKAMEAEIAALRERVEVLEKIVTEENGRADEQNSASTDFIDYRDVVECECV